MKLLLMTLTFCSTLLLTWVISALGAPSLCLRGGIVGRLMLSSQQEVNSVEQCSFRTRLLKKIPSLVSDKKVRRWVRRINLLQGLKPYMSTVDTPLTVFISPNLKQPYQLLESMVFLNKEYAKAEGTLEVVVLYHWLQNQSPLQKKLKARALFLVSLLLDQNISVFDNFSQKQAGQWRSEYYNLNPIQQIKKVKRALQNQRMSLEKGKWQ